MYRLENIKASALKDVVISQQKEIIRQTGSPLVLEDGYHLIKKQTQDFSIDDPRAKQADRLLFELFEKHQKQTHQKPVEKDKVKAIPLLSKQAIRIRENERLRVVKLLKLKLTLTQKSA